MTSRLAPLAILLCAAPAWAGSGGPDSFGYTWVDSNSGWPVPAAYDPPSSNDIRVPSDSYGTVAIGFDFPLYDQTYSTMEVQADGAITFGDPSFNGCGSASATAGHEALATRGSSLAA